ncbi:MAG: hypothetical protein JJD93_04055 [Ilumatobacteraceae bacterium]|nr:hypothetical protein [Ilumatobacteraceae bacterium]
MTDEWNPNDPDATRVHYDLANWSFEQMAELAAALADATVPHAWDGNELIVPESAEGETDDIVAQVEVRLGIAGDSDVEVPQRDAIALAEDAPSTEYDLAEWEPGERELVTSHLVARGLPFRWEEDVLLVRTEDEEVVDVILDDVENDEGVDLPDVSDDDDDDADRLPFETLTTFFLAGDRLQRNPLDADGLEQLLAAIDVADPDRPPYGVEKRLWVRTCELADDLAAALVDGDEPDAVETQAVAADLHDLLRPYV